MSIQSSAAPVLDPLSLTGETQAHKAYSQKDAAASRKYHEQKSMGEHQKDHLEKHAKLGEFIKSIVFGGLDGIVTTFAIVAAAVGSHLSYGELLIVGFANLVGDGFAMGLGDYFSSKAEDEQARALRKKYLWACEKHPEKQKRIMQKIFRSKGFSEAESSRIVECLAENKQAFVDIMLLEIEGVTVEEDTTSAIKDGIITFISFLIFGAIPLISFIFADKSSKGETLSIFFYISVGLTAVSLFLLGMLQNILLRRSWWRGGIIVLLQGGFATGIAYLAGFLLEKLADQLGK